jgi:hypothetical protein
LAVVGSQVVRPQDDGDGEEAGGCHRADGELRQEFGEALGQSGWTRLCALLEVAEDADLHARGGLDGGESAEGSSDGGVYFSAKDFNLWAKHSLRG